MMLEKILSVICVAVLIAIVIYELLQSSSCVDKGGLYVRTPYGWECIKR
jgi:hypothetical protein